MQHHGTSTEYWYAEGTLTALERLKFGVTCGATCLNEADAIPDFVRNHAKGVERLGIREIIGIGPSNPSYPKDFSIWDGGRKNDLTITFEDHYDEMERIISELNGSANGRTRLRVVIPTYRGYQKQTETKIQEFAEQARTLRELAEKHNLGVFQDGHEGGTVEFAHKKLRILGPDVCSDDCVDLSDEEMRILKDTDTKVAHTPFAWHSARMTCRAVQLIESGVTVALATDGNGPDRTFDLFKDMKHAMHYHRKVHKDTSVMPPGKILEMTTIDAAKALLLDGIIGSLEPGKRADLILLDMWKPHLVPFNMIPYRVANCATGQDVDTVIVDGRILMEERKVSILEDEILSRANEEAGKIIERTGVSPFMSLPDRFWGHARY